MSQAERDKYEAQIASLKQTIAKLETENQSLKVRTNAILWHIMHFNPFPLPLN
jgi:hypothetical protein